MAVEYLRLREALEKIEQDGLTPQWCAEIARKALMLPDSIKNEQAQNEIKKLRKALEFYADWNNWRVGDSGADYIVEAARRDAGMIAREALGVVAIDASPCIMAIEPDRYDALLGGYIAAYFKEPIGTIVSIDNPQAARLLSGELRWEYQVKRDGRRCIRLAEIDPWDVIYEQALPSNTGAD